MEKLTVEELFGGLKIITPTVYADGRGSFSEKYNERAYADVGIDEKFVQDNESWSKGGTLRGLHFQKTKPQAKLVRVAYGRAFDVAVDLRQGETFGRWFGVELSKNNGRQLFIPKGFAHGFLALSSDVCFCYKVSDYYTPLDEDGIFYGDRELNIRWPSGDFERLIISEKDKKWGSFSAWKKKA